MTINSPDPPAGGSWDNKFKETQLPDFVKNAFGIFNEIGELIHFYNLFPALKDRAIDSFSVKHLYSN